MLIFTKAAGILLLPPGIVILIGLIALLLLPRWRLPAGALFAVAVAALYALSLPATGIALLAQLENQVAALPTPDASLAQRADAIVVLGGGRDLDTPEYGGDTVNAATLERLRYAARLQRATDLPVLVSGGSVFGAPLPEAELMKRALAEDFRVPVRWVEDGSRTTYENAMRSAAILAPTGVRRVFLVTHAWHMPRALWAFRHAGIDAIPAPLGYGHTYRSGTMLDWLPTARGLQLSSRALHERLGLLWYRWRHGGERAARPVGAHAVTRPGLAPGTELRSLPGRRSSSMAARAASPRDRSLP